MRHGARLLVAGLATLLHGEGVRAQSSLDETHAAGYYAARSAAVASLTGLSLAVPAVVDVTPSVGPASEWFPGDESVRRSLSAGAARASDVSLVTTMTIPLAAQFGGGLDARFANTTLAYAEVLSVNAFLNTVVKYAVQRPRPYTHRSEPAALSYIASEGKDAYLSFYSGHASSAFSAAVSGSYMFAASNDDSSARQWMWGVEFALAAATATWRVRAGKHYYSDVIVGALVGSAIGIGIPLLEGVRYRLEATEYAFIGGGLLVGTGVAEVVHFGSSVVVPVASLEGVTVMPRLGPYGAGLSVMGRL